MVDTTETVRVQPWGEGQGEFVTINASDFDAKVHTRYVAPLDHDADGKKGGAKRAKAKPSQEEEAGDPPLTRREIEADLTAASVDFDPAADVADLRVTRDSVRG